MDEYQKQACRALLPEYLIRTGRLKEGHLTAPFNCMAHFDGGDNDWHIKHGGTISDGRGRPNASLWINGGSRKVKCFSCGFCGDIFDVIALDEGIDLDDHAAKFEAAKRVLSSLGLWIFVEKGARDRISSDFEPFGGGEKSRAAEAKKQATGLATETANAEAVEAARRFCDAAHEAVGKTDYWHKRGFTDETIRRFRLGYVENYRGQGVGLWKGAAVVPTSLDSYIIRNTDPNADNRNRYRKVSSTRLFPLSALDSEAPLFVVEGELDAISIIQAGGSAVALGGAQQGSNRERLVELLKKRRGAVVLSFDPDEAGDKARDALASLLKEAAIPYSVFNHWGDDVKDANDALRKDAAAFARTVLDVSGNAETECRLRRAQEAEDYISQTSAYGVLASFADEIREAKPSTPTGFQTLDDALGGGLFEGLYIVGAISSLGKTTFVLQIADQIAESGRDVLVFSLEMSRTELIAKSVSRLTLELDRREPLEGKPLAKAFSTRRILNGASSWSPFEQTCIGAAIDEYRERISKRVFILEGMGDIGAAQIRSAVDKHVALTGRVPVVVVDYMQILAPYDPRSTDKQNTDKAVLELKRISRDFRTPVVAISSFNRQNYNTAVSMEAFKESGAIEYSADVLIGLQLIGAGCQGFDVKAAKAAEPRKVSAVILKNRNGKTTTDDGVPFDFYPRFNRFSETGGFFPNGEDDEDLSVTGDEDSFEKDARAGKSARMTRTRKRKATADRG